MILKVSVVQMSVRNADPEENLRKTEAFMAGARDRGSELICFPEMWTSGFNWDYLKRPVMAHREVEERVAGLARKYGLWVNGSMPTLGEDGRVYNTSILFDPAGERIAGYDKIHLFGLTGEDVHLGKGRSLCLADTPWGPTGLAVCYDIRFPELFRSYALKGAKMILLPAAFPYPRLAHWKVLLRARAIENQLYLVAANQVGAGGYGPGLDSTCFGASSLIDPWGDTVLEAGETEEVLLTAELDLDLVDRVREKMKIFGDRRPDIYELG